MTMLGNRDLSPRRRRGPHPLLVGLIAFAVFLGLGYLGYRLISSPTKGKSSNNATTTTCHRSTAATLPTAGQVRLQVRNATLRTGLAHRVAHDLRKRGFHVSSVGNTQIAVTGLGWVRFGPDRRDSAEVVAEQRPGLRLVAVNQAGLVELDIGPRFHILATPAQAKTARAHDLAAAPKPSPTPCQSS